MSDAEKALSLLSHVPRRAGDLIFLLGYDVMDFIEALGEENDVAVLEFMLTYLPQQTARDTESGREKSDIAMRLVRARLDKLDGQ